MADSAEVRIVLVDEGGDLRPAREPVAAGGPPTDPMAKPRPDPYAEAEERIAKIKREQEPLDVVSPADVARKRIQDAEWNKQVEAQRLNMTEGPDESLMESGGFAKAIGKKMFPGLSKAMETLIGGGEAAGAGAAAGGAGAGLAAVAGPAALVAAGLWAANKAAEGLAAQINLATNTVAAFGEGMAKAIGGRNLEAVGEGIVKFQEGVGTALGKIPIIGQVLEATVQHFTMIEKVFAGLVQSFIARGQELAPYSGEITQARTQADVRKMGGDIREAERLGPGIAQLTDTYSRLENMMREILLPIKEWLLGRLNVWLGVIEGAFRNVIAQWEALKVLVEEFPKIIVAAMTLQYAEAAKIASEIPAKVQAGVKAALEEKDAAGKDPFFEMLMAAGPYGAMFGQEKVDELFRNGKLNAPAFGGA